MCSFTRIREHNSQEIRENDAKTSRGLCQGQGRRRNERKIQKVSANAGRDADKEHGSPKCEFLRQRAGYFLESPAIISTFESKSNRY